MRPSIPTAKEVSRAAKDQGRTVAVALLIVGLWIALMILM